MELPPPFQPLCKLTFTPAMQTTRQDGDRERVKDRAAQNKTSGLGTGHSCFKDARPESRAGPCHVGHRTVPCHIPLLSSPRDGQGKGLCCLGLFLPPHPPPKCCFPLYCSGCLFREAPQACLPGPAFPTAWSCFSPGHQFLLPLVLAMSRLAWCPGHSLRGGMTQQDMFPKQGYVESLTACVVWATFPWLGPRSLFFSSSRRSSCCLQFAP